MGRGRSNSPGAQHTSLRQPAVHGLEAGRAHARKAQRRRHRANRAATTLLSIMAIAAVGGVGWFAYSAYVEHDTNEQQETDRRVAEIERQREGRTTDDIIDQLEAQPAWNGPGNPTFGVDAEQP